MNKQILNRTVQGSWSIQLSSEDITLANGTTFTQYTLSRLHNTKADHYGESVKTYKRLATAQRNFNELVGA